MNWICVLEQAVAGTVVIAAGGWGFYGMFKGAMFVYDRSPSVRRVAGWEVPMSGAVLTVAGWGIKAVLIGVAGLLVAGYACWLYADIVIPLGRSVLNVAMGRECL